MRYSGDYSLLTVIRFISKQGSNMSGAGIFFRYILLLTKDSFHY